MTLSCGSFTQQTLIKQNFLSVRNMTVKTQIKAKGSGGSGASEVDFSRPAPISAASRRTAPGDAAASQGPAATATPAGGATVCRRGQRGNRGRRPPPCHPPAGADSVPSRGHLPAPGTATQRRPAPQTPLPPTPSRAGVSR